MSSSTIRTGGHGVHVLRAHVLVGTTNRGGVFSAQHLARLEKVSRAVGAEVECELVEFSGDHHVQLLVTYPPKVAVAKLVNSLQEVSARRLRQEFPALERRLCRRQRWSASYLAGSVGGAPLKVLRQYIENQQARLGAAPRTPIPPQRGGGGISAKDFR